MNIPTEYIAVVILNLRILQRTYYMLYHSRLSTLNLSSLGIDAPLLWYNFVENKIPTLHSLKRGEFCFPRV